MTYTSQADLVDRYGTDMLVDLTDRETPPADAIDAAVVARALDDTDAAIDGFLLGRYALPLATTPNALRGHMSYAPLRYVNTSKPAS